MLPPPLKRVSTMIASFSDVAAERLVEDGAHAGVVHRPDVHVADLPARQPVDLGRAGC